MASDAGELLAESNTGRWRFGDCRQAIGSPRGRADQVDRDLAELVAQFAREARGQDPLKRGLRSRAGAFAGR